MSQTDLPPTDACFDPEQIRLILLSGGMDDAADRLAAHLDCCERCTRVAESVNADDDVLAGLRRVHVAAGPSRGEIDDIVSRVVRLSAAVAAPLNREEAEFELPGMLGQYRLSELLGRGGMGIVYAAVDTVLDRTVAVKIARGGTDVEGRERFLNEARALAAVRHENIVTVYAFGEETTTGGTVPYMVMELLQGQTLYDWMRHQPNAPVEQIVHIARHISASLRFVHEAGLVHRDVKPGNLWVESEPLPAAAEDGVSTPGRIKLLDFGLAYQTGVFPPGGHLGTPAYAAPEQVRGDTVDARADLFSFGCILYELCTGRLPYDVRSGFPTCWAAPPPSARSLNPDVPLRLSGLISQMLTVAASDRTESIAAVDAELAQLEPSQSSGSSGAFRPQAVETGSRVRRLHPLALVGSALAIAIAIVMVMTPLLERKSSTTDRDEIVNAVASQKETPALSDPGGPLVKAPVLTDQWQQEVRALNPQQQLSEVLRALGELNPRYDWLSGSGWVEPYGVIRITINADTVSDLRPVAVLKSLQVVRCHGSEPGKGTITDLSPLSGLSLKELHCRNNPELRDITTVPFAQLEFLDASYTGVNSLEPLAAAPLGTIKIAATAVTDLSPLHQMFTLRRLDCTDCDIGEFSPLIGTGLRELRGQMVADRDRPILSQIPTLVSINRIPVSRFWRSGQAAEEAPAE